MKRLQTCGLLLLASVQLTTHSAQACDYEGHRRVNQLALAASLTNFPAYVRTQADAEQTTFWAGVPERWRNTPDLP